MDKAAVAVAILAAVLFVVVFLESIAWVKLWIKTSAAVKASETQVARAEKAEKNWSEKGEKILGELAALKAENERAHLRVDSVAESLAQFNAKAAAREREEVKRLKKEQGETVVLPQNQTQQETTTPEQPRMRLARKA